LFVAMVVHIVILAVTGDTWSGPVSLRKPADFAEAGWLVTWSVALILPLLRTRPWQRLVIGGSAILFGVGETAIMAVEAWRGVPSHYNFSTTFDAALMRGGAAGTAGVFLVGVVVLLVAVLRTGGLERSVRLGVVAGVVVLFVGCAVGFIMVSNNSGVFQGSIGGGFANRSAAYLGPDPATVGPDYLVLRRTRAAATCSCRTRSACTGSSCWPCRRSCSRARGWRPPGKCASPTPSGFRAYGQHLCPSPRGMISVSVA
jgi:hypothetical protein